MGEAVFTPAPLEMTPQELATAGIIDASPRVHEFPPPSKPLPVADQLLQQLFTTASGHQLLKWWQGDWWRWTGTHWRRVDALEVKEPLWETLSNAVVVTRDGKGEEKVTEWAPTTSRIYNLMEPLQIRTRLDNEVDAPAWLNGGHTTSPARLLAMGNGLLDLQTRELVPHTPELLNTYALGFDYDPGASCPRWERFIAEVFAHDAKGAEMLQQWFGYVVSGDMSQQKGLILIGSGRNGKGVITRVLQQLMGTCNVVGTNLQHLGKDFGLENLIDRPLAVIGDARLSPKGTETVVQSLLSIIGQDPLSVNRKNKEFWQGTLPTRIMISTNEVPRLLDASGAVVNRFLLLELVLSFKGKEDRSLEPALARELPGIFNWALQGLESLQQQGRFTVPATMEHLSDSMLAYASPVQDFMADYFQITGKPVDMVSLSQVHNIYKDWCMEQGSSPLAQAEFVRKVEAACPGVKKQTPRLSGGKRERMLTGVALLPNSIF